MTITSITPEIPRDRFGRPQIVMPDGKPAYYTRCTTLVGSYEDQFNLQKWMQRMVATGLSMRPDLQTAVHAHKDDKRELDRICEQAREAANASAAATTGTALHSLTEQVDRGQPIEALPEHITDDLDAYRVATADLEPVFIEQMMVYDDWKVAGTPDRVVEFEGRRYIADLKTGSVDFGAGKIAAQLAVYAHSSIYTGDTSRAAHGADLDRALVIHLPAGTGTCEVKWINIRAGWEIAKTCLDVREKRKLSAAQLYTKFPTKTDTTLSQALAGNRPTATEAEAFVKAGGARLALFHLIEACATEDALKALWAENAHIWTDTHTDAAKARINTLKLPAA